MAIDRHVGERIKIRRRMMGVTQQDLADACMITFQQVQKYEHGDNRIASPRLVQISRVLKTTPGFFFEGLEFPETDAAADPMTSNTAMELVRRFNKVDEVAQDLVMRILDQFLTRPIVTA